MSSDSEKLSKPSKRRRPVLSDSDSSDSSINITSRIRRIGRVVSEESSDNDSDVPMRSVRKAKNHKLASDEGSTSDSSVSGEDQNFEGGSTSSEWQSDWESMGESESEAINKNCKSKCKKTTAQLDISSGSDSNDENAVKCPICLLTFRKQEVGNPAVCEHCFCLECLIEWSKNVNTCPVDRKTFEVINVRTKLGGKIVRYVPIEPRNPAEEIVQEDPTYCEVCQRCDREDRMLLCDGCDSGFHLECLNPPMEEVPMEEHWFCPECARNTQNEAEEIDIDLDEVPDLIEEARSLGLMYGRSRANALSAAASRLRRLLPRTRQTERVRETVRTRRAVAASLINAQPSTSSGFDSISENSVPGPSRVRAANPRRTTTKRKTKRKTKRRTTAAASSSRRRGGEVEMREVRIQEINADGEIEEIVTYVRAGNSEAATSRRRRKKRKVRRLDDYDD